MKTVKLVAFVLVCSFLLGACAPEGVQTNEPASDKVEVVTNN